MQRSLRIIFFTSIILIILLIVLLAIKNLLPLEFTNYQDEAIYNGLIFLGIPMAIIFTLTGTIKKKDTRSVIIGKVLLTLLISFIPIFFAFANALNGMCAWITERILFDNRNIPSEKIVLRSFGCGAVDSGSPIYKTFKIEYYTSHLIWISDIDTTKIDKQIWAKVTNNK